MTPIPIPEEMNGTKAAGTGGRMPKGWNRLRVEVADDSDKSKSGYDQIAFQLSGRHGSARYWIVFSGNKKAFPFIKRDLEALGVQFPITELNAGALQGREVDALIDHETKAAKDDATKMMTYAVVKAFRPPDGPDPTPEHDGYNEPGSGDQQFAGAAAPGGTAPPSPAYGNEDDIPF